MSLFLYMYGLFNHTHLLNRSYPMGTTTFHRNLLDSLNIYS